MRNVVLNSLAILLWSLSSSYAAETETILSKINQQKILAKFEISAIPGQSIFLPVEFRGNQYWFFLDTGSSHTAFDISFKHELGKVNTAIIE